MDDDVVVIPSERPEVVHIAGQNDAPTETDRGRDDRRIDHMARVEAVVASNRPPTSDPMVERTTRLPRPRHGRPRASRREPR